MHFVMCHWKHDSHSHGQVVSSLKVVEEPLSTFCRWYHGLISDETRAGVKKHCNFSTAGPLSNAVDNTTGKASLL